ncbi:nitroreductase family protein [Micromonospora sagamiensis]|uniref:Nitroreductase n=1 Tax=Micromonospora sagamiensis TaxID=47875 RepID=A0A562W8M4_9ACTN|nr:nitroreductase family protein [Micromonospora sagamiensis]TWJ26643.1 nitroreductase [Micromonospora sagamiensis]BCL14470.1 nitroreductase [Micromonospora sagamiensis]
MAELSPLLAARWSPHAFDPSVELTDGEVTSLLEAARWAPSAGNRQPWRFLLGRRADEAYKRIFVHLAAENQRWAGHASALLLGAYLVPAVAHAPGRAGHDPEQAAYDLGQAVAHLTVQAGTLGLHVHQMTGFDRDGIALDLGLSDDVHPHVVVAVGRLGDPLSLPEDLRRRETELRRRRPATDLLLGLGRPTTG